MTHAPPLYVPTSQELFPPDSHPDLHPGAVHHGWNRGRQLLLHACASPHANTGSAAGPERKQAIEQLHSLGNTREIAGLLIIALYITAVEQAAPINDAVSLTTLVGEALADLGAWGVTAPAPAELDTIAQAVRALAPCMPE
ncbi:hypothetical protein AB0N09_05895 [Streptomyces erythrochromogenes]|uniref:hypothetical protein n=1 Tax=Streptomyces erythrochromogenes TaxID=285574 RepID=UPI0034495714